MKTSVIDSQLDEKLTAYMRGGTEKAFSLDEVRLLQAAQSGRGALFHGKYSFAAVALVVLLFSALFIPPVRAAVGRFFTFVPGVGIVEKTDSTIYAMNPIADKAGMPNIFTGPIISAKLENAIYANGTLNITVIVSGWHVGFDDFTLFANGTQVEFQSSGWSARGTTFTMGHVIWAKTETPNTNDLFEVEIKGFSSRLSFTLDACGDFAELAEIGATDSQNGIPITTTASREENRLTVWCYPFNTTGDRITGIGNASPSIWNTEAYIETENGHRSVHSASGQRIVERFVFDMPQGDESATLHIPYLTLVRDESKRVTIPIPADYETIKCDVSTEFSLGTVRVTEVARKPNENDSDGPDILRVNFDFTSEDDSKVFNSFRLLDVNGRMASYMSCFDEETGCLQYIETTIDDKASKFSFTISDLCYYLLGEYEIPLDMK